MQSAAVKYDETIALQIAAAIAQSLPEAHKKLKAQGQYLSYQDNPVGFCETVLGETLTDDVKHMMESVRDYQITVAVSSNAVGKSQPIDTPVLTPDGFRPIGSLSVDDFVISRNGKPTKVINIYPQGLQPTVRVTFNDGTSTLCSEDHLWDVRSSNEKYRKHPFKVHTAKELPALLHRFMHIPMCEPVEFDKKDFSIDPYVMGVLIGDGTLGQYVRFDSSDSQIVSEVKGRVVNADVRYYRKTHYGITTRPGKPNPVLESIKSFGLRGLSAHEKHIPAIYLLGSVEQRKDLLAGLMDTDGYIDYKSSCKFDTISPKLANDFQSLVWSLGGTAKVKERTTSFTYNGEKKNGQRSYRIAVKIPFCPFCLDRKKKRWRDPLKMQKQAHRLIKDIQPVGLMDSVCIEVDNQESLYLTESYIVTHNTHGGARIAIWFYKAHPNCKVFTAAAPPLDNLKNLLWGEIGSVTVKHPELFEADIITTMDIRRGPEDFLTGVTIPSSGTAQEREAKFSGKHQEHMLFVIDEGDAVPDDVYRGIESCMSGGLKVRLLIFLNPRQASGAVYRMQRDHTANVVHLSAFRHPNVIEGRDVLPGAVTRDTTVRRINEWTRPIVAGEKVEKESRFILPDFLVGATAPCQSGGYYPPLPAGERVIVNAAFAYMVLGQYPAKGTDQLISREWISRARSRYDIYVAEHGDVPPVGATGIMGMDCAELGDDANVTVARYGGYLTSFSTWGGVDTIESGTKAVDQYHKYPNISHANIDGTGVGAGIAPQMQRAGCVAVGVKVAERPTKRTELGEFRILRDQLWWSCREWLRTDPGAMLPPDEFLIEELQAPTYEVNRGRIEVMKKDDMREVLKRSPDRADALCLTFAGQGGFFSDIAIMDFPNEN